MQKCLILLAFVSYEAVRLWWWGGNGGVVDFGNIPWPRSIPTLASPDPNHSQAGAVNQNHSTRLKLFLGKTSTGLQRTDLPS